MELKVAVFVDYIGAVGGGERVAFALARALGGDVVTTDVNFESIKKLGHRTCGSSASARPWGCLP